LHHPSTIFRSDHSFKIAAVGFNSVVQI